MKQNNKLKLHEAIVKLLQESRHPMTCREIANAINQNKWYVKGDLTPIKQGQISGRINKKNYQPLFKVNRTNSPMKIGLPEWN